MGLGSDHGFQDAQKFAYNQAQSRLDPQWKNNQNDLNTQLQNQGLAPGSEADKPCP